MRSRSIGASERRCSETRYDQDEGADGKTGGRTVIFQQCGAQNFNGLSGGTGRQRTGSGGLRGGICERESEIMRPVNEDQTVKEINPHINMSPEEVPLPPPSLCLHFAGILYY